MTKEKLEKEAGNWLRKYLLCCNCEKKCNCIDSNSYCEEQVLKAYVDSAELREKRIEAFEKENAELKEQLEMSNKVYNDNLDYSYHIEEQFTKAKEIIKGLLELGSIGDGDYTYVAQAEQFLKEV